MTKERVLNKVSCPIFNQHLQNVIRLLNIIHYSLFESYIHIWSGNISSFGSFKPTRAVDGKLKPQLCWRNQITNISTCMDWPFLNSVLFVWNSPYTWICNYINKTFLLLTDVPNIVLVSDKMYFFSIPWRICWWFVYNK